MRVSKDNKSQERKLRMGITMKLNLIVIVPVLIISIVSIVQSYTYQNKTVTQMYENEMVAAAQTLNNMMNAVDSGDYSYDGTTYYKGDTELTGLSEYVKNVKEESDVSLAFFYGTEVVFTAADESRPLEDATYTKLVNDGAFSKDNVSIGEDSCYCYFVPITQPGTSEVIGAICVNAPKTDIQDMIMNNVIKIIITVVIVTVIVACIGVYISIKLAQALKKASEGMIKISDGNLDFDLDSKLLHRKDEVGEIASSLSKVLVRFKSMLIAIKDSSDNLETFTGDFRESFMSITNNIGSVNTAVNEIADGATSQAQETQNANSQIIEIGNSIDTTLDEANELDKRSRIMKDYSSNAKDTLSELNVINQKTKESITTVKVQTDITNKSAQNIREALSIINNIADQTNLLSLNASIEAARAGDAGKGFAVVADEIRNLSEQSTKSVQDIEDIINTLLSNSEISVNAMNDVNLIIEDQSSKLSDTDNMFKALLTEVDEVISGIEKIKNEVDNLNNKKSQICDSIESLSSIAEENAAGTEETSATMLSLGDIITGCKEETDKLVELSNNLQDGMSKFKF